MPPIFKHFLDLFQTNALFSHFQNKSPNLWWFCNVLRRYGKMTMAWNWLLKREKILMKNRFHHNYFLGKVFSLFIYSLTVFSPVLSLTILKLLHLNLSLNYCILQNLPEYHSFDQITDKLPKGYCSCWYFSTK